MTRLRRPGALAVALALGASCSQGAPQPVEPSAMSSAVPPPTLTAADLAGRWRWSLVTEDAGIRRVELEVWELAPDPDDARLVTGQATRTVTFLAEDGVPFSCNQGLHYQLRAEYTLRGRVAPERGDPRGVELTEVAYTTAPSPCEPGERTLATYTGALIGEHLMHLDWGRGDETLARVQAPDSAPPADASSAGAPASLTGSYRWHSRTEARDEVRVETETWQLAEDPSGAVTGTVEHAVTVFDERGAHYECSGDTFYRYLDRYTVRGQRSGAVVRLTEVAAEPASHPCVPSRERHLDAATGVLVGGYLDLTWRGRRRQVLQAASDG